MKKSENFFNDYKKIISCLMQGSGFDIKSLKERKDKSKYCVRYSYRLKYNESLPFFHIDKYEDLYSINIGSVDSKSKIFSIHDMDQLESLLPLINKQFEISKKELDGQVKWKDGNSSVVVRKGMKNETLLYFYTGNECYSASKEKSKIRIDGAIPMNVAEEFLDHVKTFLVEL